MLTPCSACRRLLLQDKPHSDEWHQVTGGSGEVNVQIQYKAAQNVPLTIDAFELLKVVGKGSFGKARRRQRFLLLEGRPVGMLTPTCAFRAL